ncbi:MAG: hypothetical protein ACXAEN_20610, partial [Candidatus Thorarchaeota archaeon]
TRTFIGSLEGSLYWIVLYYNPARMPTVTLVYVPPGEDHTAECSGLSLLRHSAIENQSPPIDGNLHNIHESVDS